MDLKAALCFLSLPALLCSASADQGTKYVRVGADLQLTPPFSGPIENIQWKREGNLLAERLKGRDSEITYGAFKDRTTVDKTTGRLEVKNLGPSDSGTYTVEINDKVLDYKHLLKVIQEVPSASVRIKLVFGQRILTCEGNTDGAEPVTYYWRNEGGDWVKSSKNMNITADDTKHVETFSCRMENPVSTRDSEPRENPLFVPHTPTDLTWLWVVLGLFFVVCLVALLVIYIKKSKEKKKAKKRLEWLEWLELQRLQRLERLGLQRLQRLERLGSSGSSGSAQALAARAEADEARAEAAEAPAEAAEAPAEAAEAAVPLNPSPNSK